jgi:hypothetical protein
MVRSEFQRVANEYHCKQIGFPSWPSPEYTRGRTIESDVYSNYDRTIWHRWESNWTTFQKWCYLSMKQSIEMCIIIYGRHSFGHCQVCKTISKQRCNICIWRPTNTWHCTSALNICMMKPIFRHRSECYLVCIASLFCRFSALVYCHRFSGCYSKCTGCGVELSSNTECINDHFQQQRYTATRMKQWFSCCCHSCTWTGVLILFCLPGQIVEYRWKAWSAMVLQPEVYYGIFVDLYLLAQAKWFVYGRGGYGLWANMISNPSGNTHSLPAFVVTTVDYGTLTCWIMD